MDKTQHTTAIAQKVQDALQEIRPFLEADRGDVSLVEITPDGIARVEFHGACRDCSMSYMTLKAGVEQSILKAVPEIRAVEAINLIRQA